MQPCASHSLDQALGDLTVQELCTLMKNLNLNYCARAFGEVGLDGADLLELSKDDLIPMLTEAGKIVGSHRACL